MEYRAMEVPPEVDRSIMVVGIQGSVVGLHRSTGAIVWKTRLDRDDPGTVFIALRHGLLVASAEARAVVRLDYATGEALWTVDASGFGRATILIESDCILVGKNGYVDCFGHDGSRLWKQELKGLGNGAMSLAFPGNIAQADSTS